MKHFSEYEKARTYAQETANRDRIFFRLRRATLEGGYYVSTVPMPKNQFGRDLQGEHIMPITNKTEKKTKGAQNAIH